MIAAATDTGIRIAGFSDESELFALLLRVGHRSTYAGSVVDEGFLTRSLRAFLENPHAAFLVAEEDGRLIGLLALLCYPHLLTGELRACELCWWVDEGKRRGVGLDLLRAGEHWATQRGAAALEMMAPDRRFQSVLERRGYVSRSTVYERSL